MSNIILKVVNEGFGPSTETVTNALREQLEAEGWKITNDAPLTLKVKFFHDLDHERILVKLRETASEIKIDERVIPYFTDKALGDIHTLVLSMLLNQEV
ncbi:MAG: XisH protein [Bacteroidota bacterium]|jgi:hypothetical protein